MSDSIAAQEFQNTFEKLSKNFKNVARNVTLDNVDKFTENNINKLKDDVQSKIQSTNLDNKAKIDNLTKSIEFILNAPEQSGGSSDIDYKKKYLKYKTKYLHLKNK